MLAIYALQSRAAQELRNVAVSMDARDGPLAFLLGFCLSGLIGCVGFLQFIGPGSTGFAEGLGGLC